MDKDRLEQKTKKLTLEEFEERIDKIFNDIHSLINKTANGIPKKRD